MTFEDIARFKALEDAVADLQRRIAAVELATVPTPVADEVGGPIEEALKVAATDRMAKARAARAAKREAGVA